MKMASSFPDLHVQFFHSWSNFPVSKSTARNLQNRLKQDNLLICAARSSWTPKYRLRGLQKQRLFKKCLNLQSREAEMGVIRSAIGDAILTSMWVFSTPFLGVSTSIIASYLGVEPKSTAALFITVHLATLLLLTFSWIGGILGGATFNPTATVSLYAAGLRPGMSLMSMAVRFPAQAAGGAGGALAIFQAMPKEYKHMLKGPSLSVDLRTGPMVGGVHSFLYCLSLLLVMIKGPKSFLLKIWLLAWARALIGLVVAGGKQTGTSTNPASAYGWAYVYNRHNTWELFYVYWICPFIGATLAAFAFRFLFKTSNKHKQA